MTRVLLGDLSGITDPNYGGSIALALGCIHHSAGGMALSTLVPATVSSVSSLAKTFVLGLKIWALHGLLLTIEADGLSFVSHVQTQLDLISPSIVSCHQSCSVYILGSIRTCLGHFIDLRKWMDRSFSRHWTPY